MNSYKIYLQSTNEQIHYELLAGKSSFMVHFYLRPCLQHVTDVYDYQMPINFYVLWITPWINVGILIPLSHDLHRKGNCRLQELMNFFISMCCWPSPPSPCKLLSPWFCECLGHGLFPDLVCIFFYTDCYERQKGISNFWTLVVKIWNQETRLKSSTWVWSNNSSHVGKFGSVLI